MTVPDMNATDLFAQITAMPRPHRVVDFVRKKPGTDEPLGQVAYWVLNQNEVMAVAADAEIKARRLLKDNVPGRNEQAKGYDDVLNNAKAVELLYRAARKADDLSKPFFPSKEAIGQVLTNDEISTMLNDYMTVQVQLSPIVGHMDSAEVEAWVKKLAEGGSDAPFFLNSFSWEAMKGLLIAMASQLYNSQTGKFSPGLPHDADTTSL